MILMILLVSVYFSFISNIEFRILGKMCPKIIKYTIGIPHNATARMILMTKILALPKQAYPSSEKLESPVTQLASFRRWQAYTPPNANKMLRSIPRASPV